ncbi:hypothetical protein [Lewinella sp. 4G2]|uniref:hypothetical protein n=1 Tax=Lewinella sp. 4G2 TaxID=1803372 RepID=UPI0007B4CCF0|nr:hypothetical protein [Lewinella sp. 4G2]OAV44835.1 hypothetical protein A3850_010185 [Lewinella sp. 4G2]
MTNNRDIILTGVPRSGTTLACFLLSKIPHVVALNEPMRTAKYRSRSEALSAVPEFYADTRKSILERGVATARAVKGKMTTNHFAQVKGKRVKLVSKQEIEIDKPLGPDFRLACKHNALFTILQDDLRQDHPFFAIIRNPLAVLASWKSVEIPASRGEVRALDYLLPEAGERLKAAGDVDQRQLFILDWYFRKYAELEANQVIKYEDIIATDGKALSVVDAGAKDLNEDLSSRNRSKVYDWDTMGPLAEKLLASDNACWQFYERAEVEKLIAR